MGLYERDYMRRRHEQARPRANQSWASRFRTPSSGWRDWLPMGLVFGTVLFALMLGAKHLAERRARVPFPESGNVFWYRSNIGLTPAMLTLRAPSDSKLNFAVRLEDWATREPLALIPIRAGETSVTMLPLGRYRMTIAKGSTWMGSHKLFGSSGEVREVVHPVEFYRQGSMTVGQKFDLEVPFVGNVQTKPVF